MIRISLDELNSKIMNEEVIFAVFSAEWCGQCKMSKLLIEKVMHDFPNVIFVEVDVDENKLWDDDTLKISQVPTFVGFKNKSTTFNVSGYQVEEELIKLLKQL